MSHSPIILEFGSQSLKVHFQSQKSGVFRKVRFAWNLGHEVYSTGRVSKETAQLAIDTIQKLREKGFNPRNLMAIATGALRDAENRKQFVAALEEKLETEVRIISGQEEASLLAHGYLQQYTTLPALIADIGGGSLEVVYLGEDRSILRDSLPLGAIRLWHLGLSDGTDFFGERVEGSEDVWNEDLVSAFIDANLEEASLMTARELFVTGGTGKAIAKMHGEKSITTEGLSALIDRVRRDGPPEFLKPDRRKVLLPGLIALEHLLRHAQSEVLTYLKIPAGRIFLQRLASKLARQRNEERRRVVMRDMRITSIYPKKSGILPALESQIIPRKEEKESDG